MFALYESVNVDGVPVLRRLMTGPLPDMLEQARKMAAGPYRLFIVELS